MLCDIISETSKQLSSKYQPAAPTVLEETKDQHLSAVSSYLKLLASGYRVSS